MLKDENETLNTFYHGRIFLLQKKKGYRFSVDAPLLADFIQTKESDNLCEFGTGNGVISLLLSMKPFNSITALEIQSSLARLALRNVCLNHLEGKIFVVQTDLVNFCPRKKFDVVFSNPPYIKKKTGHLSALDEKSIAKHELKCDIFDIMQKTADIMKRDGRAYFIFPTKRKEDFMSAAKKSNLRIKALRFVFPQQHKNSNFFMAECDFFSERITEMTPFILYDESGQYTPEAQKIFSGS